jgi:four helix bundle protein
VDDASRELERRTKGFALRVIAFVAGFPKTKTSDVLAYQLIDAGTSIGANYREANRAESHADFIHKIGVVEKEASETHYWLELCQESGIGESIDCAWLLQESDELIRIFTRVGKTAKSRYRPKARNA